MRYKFGKLDMDLAGFESVKAYVGFTEDTAAALREFHPHAKPHFSRTVDDFYAAIEAHPRARRVITGGHEQITRLKGTLMAWLDSVLLGPHDLRFLQAHSRIGHVHVRIGLPEDLMFTSMNRIRARLHEVVEQTFAAAPERRKVTTAAVNQILDIDLAIMLDTYRLDSEEKQRAAERLVTIGQLAASIGHELRNPLATIESSLYLMNQHMTRENVRDPELEKHLGKIWKQVQHCGQTITNLLDLARDRPPHRREHSLRQIVEQSLERTALSDAVRVEVQVPPALKVFADGDDLSLILVNLLANANQAITGPGQIIIRGGAYKGGTEIYVEDDGPGIAPEIRSKVFEALFTTRARGTGLGLALCMRIVDAHHGELSLEPSQGGAIFRIWLPDRAKPID